MKAKLSAPLRESRLQPFGPSRRGARRAERTLPHSSSPHQKISPPLLLPWGELPEHRGLPPDSEMLVGKGDLLAHRDIRFDRPFEDQNHVTMARHARGLRQLVETLDRLRGQLHRDGAGFS